MVVMGIFFTIVLPSSVRRATSVGGRPSLDPLVQALETVVLVSGSSVQRMWPSLDSSLRDVV